MGEENILDGRLIEQFDKRISSSSGNNADSNKNNSSGKRKSQKNNSDCQTPGKGKPPAKKEKKTTSSYTNDDPEKGKITNGNHELKKDEKSENNEDNVKDLIDEDKFEKTANELEEVLKRKFPDDSPPKISSPKSHFTSKTGNNTNVPTLTTSQTIKQEVKEELGLTSKKENDKITNT